jgi:hypothetical protein
MSACAHFVNSARAYFMRERGQVAEKTKNLGVRGTTEMHRKLRQLSLDTGKSVQRLFEDAIQRAYFSPNPPPTPFPHPFTGLSDDEIWTLTNLIEILRARPQGAIYRSLDHTLNEAVQEWRKAHRQTNRPPTIPTSAGISELTSASVQLEVSALSNPSVSIEEDPWVSRLVKILRSKHAIAIQAVLSNLVAFEELADGSSGNLPDAQRHLDADVDPEVAALYEKTQAALRDPLGPGAHGSRSRPGKGRDHKRTGTESR